MEKIRHGNSHLHLRLLIKQGIMIEPLPSKYDAWVVPRFSLLKFSFFAFVIIFVYVFVFVFYNVPPPLVLFVFVFVFVFCSGFSSQFSIAEQRWCVLPH